MAGQCSGQVYYYDSSGHRVDCLRAKKTWDSSSSAAITKAPFEAFPAIGVPKSTQTKQKKKEYVHVRPLPIPQMVDDYNHFMNGVDIADQL
jgi:hypothetical protein